MVKIPKRLYMSQRHYFCFTPNFFPKRALDYVRNSLLEKTLLDTKCHEDILKVNFINTTNRFHVWLRLPSASLLPSNPPP